MKKWLSIMSIILLLGLWSPAGASDKASKEQDRLENSGEVLQEILNIPDDIPKPLLDKAECVIVFPSVMKFAIGIGGSYGRGAMSCRTGEHFTGPWSPPAMYALEGGNIGFQLGGQATDFVLLVMNPRGVKSILKTKVKLGADAAAAAGPKGRDAAAATDAFMRAEILSYSRSRGLFAGISLEGSTLRQDNNANERLYGRKVTAREIVRQGAVSTPASGQLLITTLEKASPTDRSEAKSLAETSK
jgi:lipid-binding SYLF domain-containing protein